MDKQEYAVVVPADMGKDPFRIDWPTEGDTLDILYREIGCDMVQLTPATGEVFALWADEESKLRATDEWVVNVRATHMWMEANDFTPHFADALIGDVVVTSIREDETGEGRTIGLAEAEAEDLIAGLTEVTMDTRRWTLVLTIAGVPTAMVRETAHVTVKIENTYACGRESTHTRQVPAPAYGKDWANLDEWFAEHVQPHTGDGHPCGSSERAHYEAEIMAAPSEWHAIVGRQFTIEG